MQGDFAEVLNLGLKNSANVQVLGLEPLAIYPFLGKREHVKAKVPLLLLRKKERAMREDPLEQTREPLKVCEPLVSA